jgi:hypothetical protein
MEEFILCQPVKPKKKQVECNFNDCNKCPNYNYKGEKIRLYCSSHKLEGMVDIKNKHCENVGCTVLPVFNYSKTKIPRFCNSHKLTGMVNIKDKTCKFNSCTTIPIFNYVNEDKAIYCNLHKLIGMVDIKNKTCENVNCHIQSNYNYQNETKARFCVSHKLDGMADVKNKRCKYNNCKTVPIFNYKEFNIGLYCSLHKLEGMINVIDKYCIYDGCTTRPSYNIEGETKGLYCSIHKLNGMADVKSKTCKTNLCYTLVKNKYNGYCLRCFIHLFPDQPVTRNYKTKESATAQFITTNFQNFTWNLDKKVEDGCSRRRPDLMCDLGYQVIIVEVDENQHTDYDCSCENKRIMQLSQDIGHRPIIFIRFNPDTYINSNGDKITSCWGITPKTGILKIKNNKNDEWDKRLTVLKETIEYWTNEDNKTEKIVEVIQLFYNQNI